MVERDTALLFHLSSYDIEQELEHCENLLSDLKAFNNKIYMQNKSIWKADFVLTNDTHDMNVSSEIEIPEYVLYYLFLFNFWGVGLATSILGIIANILNIITFLKQSRKDAVNISLLGLAITDFGSLYTLFMTNICFLPQFQALDLSFIPLDFMYIWAWLHIMLTRVTSWITAYITFERCLCIAHPLKVKEIITPKRTTVSILVLYIIMLISVAPVYYPIRAAHVFDPIKNKTLMGISFVTDRNEIETISFVINFIVPASAFSTVIICTTILVKKLRSKGKWRKSSSRGDQVDALSTRDAKVIKMVVFISAVFIICYCPGTVVYVWVIIDPKMRIDGRHVNLLLANFSVLFHLESINASVGIFIYMFTSSKYKKAFLQTFCGIKKNV